MKYISYLFIISVALLSCHTAKRSEVVDYYPRSIPNLGNNSKNTVFLYKKREISSQQFFRLANNKKNLSVIIIKDPIE
ncbi:hypothetical protein [Riemerella anatipestifer]|uniref:hypothetical protein n=1 Tax=Riemerella anatipestifer TaxID=34085 RepID=UPI001BD9D8F8|nr:hypothetical protein [Riemerella anatipestifer]MBT0551484.1 hypothetical protein [Riemerella anatipestifer]MBT0553861.1 hypothetical protein [Riemerella anatipestifer]MCE3024243.1 hypothetical protein [Riemerella anatipestifer]MCU7542700.1 hypothetical protein [Riemerella anatipestifer]MCU7559810.1 hypothetical protein [Riemerella anatipestifer]